MEKSSGDDEPQPRASRSRRTPARAARNAAAHDAHSRLATAAPATHSSSIATVAQLSDFEELIDVRSESEYREDHIPGAINCPVLDDSERALVGTLYTESSAFEAKKLGAALVSINIARHLRERFHSRTRSWRPLVYCWRGGGRSAALAHVLAQIGWRVGRLEGGYKAYRRHVLAELDTLPERFAWRVICGVTGTGKSRLLRAVEAAGAQVLDLEGLAAHRGSVLGDVPQAPQPTQKMFESLVWHALARMDPAWPVYVESESRKIGRLRVPQALIDAMWQGECIALEAPLAVRLALLKVEYAHYLAEPEALCAQLEHLLALHGRDTIARWQHMARNRQWDALVAELLVRHYDPAYTRAITKHYPALAHARRYRLEEVSDAAFERLATSVLQEAETLAPAAR
jgi:tRNA 2-selenouridine synthase